MKQCHLQKHGWVDLGDCHTRTSQKRKRHILYDVALIYRIVNFPIQWSESNCQCRGHELDPWSRRLTCHRAPRALHQALVP